MSKKEEFTFVKKDDLKVSVMKIREWRLLKRGLDDGHTIIVDWKKEYIERGSSLRGKKQYGFHQILSIN